ncbi:hypothetical protein [Bradyrhizobium sp. UFLA05-112]
MNRASIREDVDGPSREVTTFKLRDEWVRLAAVQKLSPVLRVIGMRLAHFLSDKGQLNPSYALLAAECVTTERTAQKAVAAFRRLGMIADTRTAGGHHDATNNFILILPYRRVFIRTPVKGKSVVSTGTPVKTKSGPHRGVRTGIGRVSSEVADGCPQGHPNSVMNSVMNSGRANGARTARVDGASSTNSDDAPSSKRAVPARGDPTVEQSQPPSASPSARPSPPPAPPMGRPQARANDPGFDAVRTRARRLLRKQADVLVDRLIDAYDGEIELILDTLACAEEEPNPREYVERDIEQALALAREGADR